FEVNVPTKFYEYIACGKPLIGICGGEPEKIINSYNIGRTVRPTDIDGLVEIISDFKNSPSMLQTIEQNSHIALERFSLDNLASDFASILKSKNVIR
ncbi:MAG TPA: hypothetical protein VE076_02055, partial [Nitrososphaeraceae archaeon]|nr:hypothetical protein [Nitrososphaeraceae archaeon]